MGTEFDVPKTMRAAVLHGAEDVRFEEVPVPATGPGEILARVEAASMDFTDRKVFLRGRHPMIEVPGLFGHEWAGTIVRLGAGVRAPWRPGMRVVAANSAPCGADDAAGLCRLCRLGRQSMCERILYNNGAFAPFIRVPERIVRANLHPISDGVPFEEAALAEPVACAIHGARRMPVAPGSVVAIVGAGPMGLILLAALRREWGDRIRVISLDHHDDRLAVAKELGAFAALNTSRQDAARMVRALLAPGEAIDVAIEAVGTLEAHRDALGLLGRGGTLVSFGGVTPGESLAVDIGRMHYEEIGILPTYHHTPRDFAAAVEAIARREIPVGRLITTRLLLEALPEALRMVGEKATLKIVLTPGGS